MALIEKIDEISSNPRNRKAWLALACIIFAVIIVIPAIFVIFSIPTRWDDIQGVLADSDTMSIIWGAIWNSFSLAFIVTVLDIVVGLPMAWMLVRKNYRFNKYLDTLIDMPLAFPTVALGFSVIVFWGCPNGITVPGLGLVMSPYLMVVLLHLIFTYPYMVRCLSGILEQIDTNCETAAMTLGASKWTAVRTITLPLFRAGLVTGFILCFARSLSETGGTYIVLTMMGASTFDINGFFTGPTLISELRHMSQDPTSGLGDAVPELILISSLLIVFALLMLFLAKTIMTRLKIPWRKVWPRFGRRVSGKKVATAKDSLAFMFALIFILIPSFYIFVCLGTEGSYSDYGGFLSAVGTSFLVAGVATVFDIIFGIPVAMYIARNRGSKRAELLDNLVNVPLIIPTTALGFSLGLFWGGLGLSSCGVLLVIFGHISFTYPLLVRNLVGAIEEVDPSYEEIARTLGAKPFQAFRKVLLPMVKSSLLAGAVLAFTRSLGETGATQAISNTVNTVPIYIVNFINGDIPNYFAAAVSSVMLIAICFVFMFGLRIVIDRMGGKD